MKSRMASSLGIVFGLFCAASVFGCGGKNVAPGANSASELAESVLSGAVNSTEPGGTQAYYPLPRSKALWARFRDFFTFLPESRAAAVCPTLTTSTCTAGSVAMTYSSCSFTGTTNVWSGSQTVSLSGGCPSSLSLANLNAQTLTRTFGAGTTETNAAGVVTAVDTTTASSSGWDTGVTGVGNGMTAQFTNTTGNRTLTIKDVHLKGADASGTALFDVTVSSGGLAVTGAGTSRAVGSGAYTLQHNLSQFTAQINITTALAYSMASCCHPASGVFTTTLTGSVKGSETLTFTGASTGICGSATYVDASGNTGSVTLTHCL